MSPTKSSQPQRTKDRSIYPPLIQLLLTIIDTSYKWFDSMYPQPIDWNGQQLNVTPLPRDKIYTWDFTFIIIMVNIWIIPISCLLSQKSSNGEMSLLDNLNMAAIFVSGTQSVLLGWLFRFYRSDASIGINSILSVLDEVIQSKINYERTELDCHLRICHAK